MHSRKGQSLGTGTLASVRNSCGTAGKIVGRRCITSRIMFFGGCTDLISSIDPPTSNGSSMPTVIMNEWNSGSSTTKLSSSTAAST